MWEYLWLFFQILLINIVLSGDNAVVIAMASKNLPEDQRKKAILWGAVGAIGLRLALTVVAVAVLGLPYIHAIGSILLLYIAVKLLAEDDGGKTITSAKTLSSAVWTIIGADFIMSLDNVLAIAATAKNNITIIILGISLSIPLIIWGSAVVVKLLTRFPVLVYLGAGILGYTAGEMFASDKTMQELVLRDTVPHWTVSVAAAVIVVLIGGTMRWMARRRHARHSH